MDFKPLLNDPEKYRAGLNYRATHIVFPVEYDGKMYVVKRPRHFGASTVINAYYALQGSRKLVSGRRMTAEEARKLGNLDGCHAPRLIAYDNGTIVKEFLEGTAFRDMADINMLSALESAVKSLSDIHKKGVVMGSCHAKNIIYAEGESYFCDFDGVFDESDITRSKIYDLLGLIYSSFTITRDRDIMLRLAEAAADRYGDESIKYGAGAVLRMDRSGLLRWFAARIPIRENSIEEKIADILSR